jgi:AmpE protein
MTLISLLIALFIERFSSAFEEWRNLDVFANYARKLSAFAGRYGNVDGYLGLALILLPPLILVSLLQGMLSAILLGLLGMVFAIVVLVLALGRDLEEDTNRYVEACASGEESKVRSAASVFLRDEEPAAECDLLQKVVESVFVEANNRYFAVIFWFLLLCPVGAVMYRLSVELKLRHDIGGEGLEHAATFWVALLDWAPARLAAIAYALTGSFEHALAPLRKHLFTGFANLSADNSAVLAKGGSEAIVLDQYLKDDVDGRLVAIIMGLVSNLLLRSLAVWIGVIALMTISNLI